MSAATNSTCAVFAETEIVGLLASGAAPADIAAGVQTAVARRIATLAGGWDQRVGRLYRRRGAGPGDA